MFTLRIFSKKKWKHFLWTSIWMMEVNMNDQYASSLQGWPSWELENFQIKKNENFFFNFDLNDWSEHEWSIRFFTARMTVMRVRKISKKKNDFFSTSIWMMVLNMNYQYASSLQGWPSWELENFQRKKMKFFFQLRFEWWNWTWMINTLLHCNDNRDES